MLEELEVGKKYQFKTDDYDNKKPLSGLVICQLQEFRSYPATGMPPDYIFKLLEGDFPLNSVVPGCFCLPMDFVFQLIHSEYEFKEYVE